MDEVEALFVLFVDLAGASVFELEELGELSFLVLEVDEDGHEVCAAFEGADDESQVVIVDVVRADVAVDAAEDALGFGDDASGDGHDGGVDVVFVGSAADFEEGDEALEELACGGDGADGAAPEELVVEVELGDDLEELVEGHFDRAVLVAAEHGLELLCFFDVVEVQLDHVVVRLGGLGVLGDDQLDADLELFAEGDAWGDGFERLEAVSEVLSEEVHDELLEVLASAEFAV